MKITFFRQTEEVEKLGKLVYLRFFQFWLIFLNRNYKSHSIEYNFKLKLTSYTSSEEENILYFRKFGQNIKNNDEGRKLFEEPLTSMRVDRFPKL